MKANKEGLPSQKPESPSYNIENDPRPHIPFGGQKEPPKALACFGDYSACVDGRALCDTCPFRLPCARKTAGDDEE